MCTVKIPASYAGFGSGHCGHEFLRSLRWRLLDRNLNSAVHAFCYKNEIDNASELVRNEISYEIGAVAGLDLGRRRGTASLAPVQDQGCRGSGRPTMPTDRYLAAGDR